jgi:hypothetical protein
MTSNHTITLTDAESVRDFDTFVGRAEQIENKSVRLVAEGNVLAVWVQVLSPRGLSDTTPTVLGMRGFSLATPSTFDVVVPAARESLHRCLQVESCCIEFLLARVSLRIKAAECRDAHPRTSSDEPTENVSTGH